MPSLCRDGGAFKGHERPPDPTRTSFLTHGSRYSGLFSGTARGYFPRIHAGFESRQGSCASLEWKRASGATRRPGTYLAALSLTCNGVACRRRQKKYESPRSTPLAAAQLHTSGASPTEKCAMIAEASVMAKPAYAHSLSRAG